MSQLVVNSLQLEAWGIPPGTGLELSRRQILLLDHLVPAERYRRMTELANGTRDHWLIDDCHFLSRHANPQVSDAELQSLGLVRDHLVYWASYRKGSIEVPDRNALLKIAEMKKVVNTRPDYVDASARKLPIPSDVAVFLIPNDKGIVKPQIVLPRPNLSNTSILASDLALNTSEDNRNLFPTSEVAHARDAEVTAQLHFFEDPANATKIVQTHTLRRLELQLEDDIELDEMEEEKARQRATLEKGGKCITPVTKSIPAIRRTKPRPIPAKGGAKASQGQPSDQPQQIISESEEGSEGDDENAWESDEGSDDDDDEQSTDVIDDESDNNESWGDLSGTERGVEDTNEPRSIQSTAKGKERAVDSGSDEFSDEYYEESQNNAGDDKFYFHQKNRTVNPVKFVMTAGHLEQSKKFAKQEGIHPPTGFVPKAPVFYSAGLVPQTENDSSTEEETGAPTASTVREQQLAAYRKQKAAEDEYRKRVFKETREAQNRGEVVSKNTLQLNNEERVPHNFPRLTRRAYKDIHMLRRLPTPAEQVSYFMERNENEGFSSDRWDIIMPTFDVAVQSVLTGEHSSVPPGAAPHVCLPMYIMFDGLWVESHPKCQKLIRYKTWWDESKDGPNAKRLIDQETRKYNENSMFPYATSMPYFKYEFFKMGLVDEYRFHRNEKSDPIITFTEIIFRYSTLDEEEEFDQRQNEPVRGEKFRLSVLPPLDEEGNAISEVEMWKKVITVFRRSTMDVDHDSFVFEFGIEGQWPDYDPAGEVVQENDPDHGENWEDLYDDA